MILSHTHLFCLVRHLPLGFDFLFCFCNWLYIIPCWIVLLCGLSLSKVKACLGVGAQGVSIRGPRWAQTVAASDSLLLPERARASAHDACHLVSHHWLLNWPYISLDTLHVCRSASGALVCGLELHEGNPEVRLQRRSLWVLAKPATRAQSSPFGISAAHWAIMETLEGEVTHL